MMTVVPIVPLSLVLIATSLTVSNLGDRVGARLGGTELEAFLGAQQQAFRLAAALGLVGALISVARGAEAPAAH
jgi:hypothetical protein